MWPIWPLQCWVPAGLRLAATRSRVWASLPQEHCASVPLPCLSTLRYPVLCKETLFFIIFTCWLRFRRKWIKEIHIFF